MAARPSWVVEDEWHVRAKRDARDMWARGSYRKIAFGMLAMPARLVKAVGPMAGHSALDVACGTGVTAITAARAGASVVGLDLTPELLTVARNDAHTAGADIAWCQGDGEALPFRDATFEVVLSSVGHVYAPRAECAGAEMVRVLRPGGRLGYTAWAGDHFHGAMARLFERHVRGPRREAARWWDPREARRLLGNEMQDISVERATFEKPALSARHYWQHAIVTSPVLQGIPYALEGDEARIDAFRSDFLAVVEAHLVDNAVRQEYVVVSATKA